MRSRSLNLYVSEEIAERTPFLTMEGFVDGESIGIEEYHAAGDHVYSRMLPANFSSEGWLVEFVLNRAIAPDVTDKRERGIIVSKCGLDRVS